MADSHHTPLDRRLRSVWQREQLLFLSHGGLAIVRWGLVLFLAGVLIDWLIKLPVAGRIVILLVVTGGALFKAWQAGWRSFRRFEPAHTALQVERQHGGMESLLVSAVQLRKTAPVDALVQLTCGKAEQAAAAIQPRNAIRFGTLRRPAAFGCGMLLLVGVLSLTHGGLLKAGLGRIFAPWAAISYPTRTQLTLAAGDLVVQEGYPITILAQVAGVVPSKAKLALRTGTGRPIVRTLPIAQGRCEYAIDTAYRSFEYSLKAGDARTDWHRVQVVNAPNIEQAEVTLAFPAYTMRPSETVDALTLTVPETTRIRWKLVLDQAVHEATMNLAGEEPVPLEISADGLTVSIERVASESRAYSFSWIERDHRFAFTGMNHYLQVAPDRAPRVELTSPSKNLYATLGRKVELAFRGRDDHGIGESVVTYRIDKTGETRVAFEPSAPIDGTEQVVDWDYRNELKDLAIGQTVAFVIELADRHPGPDGPHRARSQARWVQFMSREDYLAQVEEEKRRLLSQLKLMYREERKVHEAVLRLDPSDPVFVQSCQLEAVRQGLMRERLNGLAGSMQDMTEDLAANNFTQHPIGSAVSELRTEALRISDEHLAAAAPALRTLAGEAGSDAPVLAAAKAKAVAAVDDSARELGLLVLQLGYNEAADVMARELHAAAATQAALRLRTIVQQEDAAELAAAQERLGVWLNRLFAASPGGRESTVQEALTAFTLSRTVKQMVKGGMQQRIGQAADGVRNGRADEASRLQAEVIQALLKAEFRLGVGAERDALAAAHTLLETLAGEQAKLGMAIAAADAATYQELRDTYSAAQAALHRKLQVLLMPPVPAPRTRLFDECVPSPPPVADLLSTADAAVKQAMDGIGRGEREAVRKAQETVETSFAELAQIANVRIAAVTLLDRADRLRFATEEINKRFDQYTELQVGLLEKTEDAAADETQATYLADRQASLADTIQQHREELAGAIEDTVSPAEHALALPECLDDVVRAQRQAVELLKADKPGEAIAHQQEALSTIAVARELFAGHIQRLGLYLGAVAALDRMAKPGSLIAEIIEEQRDLIEVTRRAKAEQLPALAISQKNLVHAVNAILGALTEVSGTVESGNVIMFAKEDMESAAEALLKKDPVEALDAQEFIVESLEELHKSLEEMVPQYGYVLEITEAVCETAHEGVRLSESQRRRRAKVLAGGETGALAREQAEIMSATKTHGAVINRITGLGLVERAVAAMAEAESALKQDDGTVAAEKMAQAKALLKGDAAMLGKCLSHLGLVPAASTDAETAPEAALLKQVLTLAIRHKTFARENCSADGDALKGLESGLREFVLALDPFIAEAETHKNPGTARDEDSGKPPPPASLHLKLVEAKEHFGQAAAGAKAGDRERSRTSQDKAADSLRHFVVDYALKFLKLPGGAPPPPPPAPADILQEQQDQFDLYLPGAVTGKRPPDGRLEWEVLGKRDRAALNENFARELPLEHRDTLKNYYERLTQ